MKGYRPPVSRANFKEHPWRTTLIAVVGVACVVAWIVLPDWKADAVVAHRPPAKSCALDDPCSRTLANWKSPQHMHDRFVGGASGNARGHVLPEWAQLRLTKQWNEDHGVVSKDCGDHWWCHPLDVGSCMVAFFLCTAGGDALGWQKTEPLRLKCGGATAIGFGFGGWTGAGAGASACLYDTLGSHYGWWS